MVSFTSPSLKKRKVGIDETPYFSARAPASSILTLPTLATPSTSPATASTRGPTGNMGVKKAASSAALKNNEINELLTSQQLLKKAYPAVTKKARTAATIARTVVMIETTMESKRLN